MQAYHNMHAVEHDGTVTTNLSPQVRTLIERIARCGHMIQMHREGIVLNQRRILEAQAELARIEGGRQ